MCVSLFAGSVVTVTGKGVGSRVQEIFGVALQLLRDATDTNITALVLSDGLKPARSSTVQGSCLVHPAMGHPAMGHPVRLKGRRGRGRPTPTLQVISQTFSHCIQL